MSGSVSLSVGGDKFCDVQIWTAPAERVAENVRPGKDVPLLFQPLEVGDSVGARSQQSHGRPQDLQRELHQVCFARADFTFDFHFH